MSDFARWISAKYFSKTKLKASIYIIKIAEYTITRKYFFVSLSKLSLFPISPFLLYKLGQSVIPGVQSPDWIGYHK
jgi:hypothetical protein